MAALPNGIGLDGIGLVRAETPWGPVVFVSERLTAEEAAAARVLAADRVVGGHLFVLLKVADIEERLDLA